MDSASWLCGNDVHKEKLINAYAKADFDDQFFLCVG